MISDADFALWLLRPDRDPVCTIEADYQIESSGEPVQATLFLSDKPYFLGTQAYDDCVQSVPNFQRSLSGERLGVYQSSYGKIVLNNHDGSSDYILSLALDGSQARFKFGDRAWDISDHRLMFIVQLVRASAPSTQTIEIDIKDASALLDQSIGGTSPVGGTGPNADRLRPINLGFVRQVECLAIDDTTLLFDHSDTGVNTTAVAVRNRGIGVTYVDNGDGTVTLDAGLSTAEKGGIVADVLALAADADPSDITRRRTSDIIDALVRDRAGLGVAGLYAGAGPTFTVADDDDYLSGISIPTTQNLMTVILPQVTDSGNCFWAVNRLNQFTFGRLRPNDIATLPVVPFAITSDDVDIKAQFSVDHELPTYYLLQAYMSKNWTISQDLVTSLTPEERAALTRPGLFKIQDAAVGVTYADAPELYDLSLVVSPTIETLLSGDDDTVDIDALIAWMETARFAILPLQENLHLTVGLEFYQQELGDAMAATITRVDGSTYFGIDVGSLFQVTGINLRLTDQKIDFVFRRRRLSTPYPDGWVRVTTEADADTTTSFEFDSEAPPVVVPAPVPPGGGGITSAPWYPGSGTVGFAGISASTSFSVFADGVYPFDPYVLRVADTNADYLASSSQTGTETAPGNRVSFTGDGKYMVVGDPQFDNGSGHTGIVRVFKWGGSSYSQIATLTYPTLSDSVLFGAYVDVSDQGVIAAAMDDSSGKWAVFLPTGTDTWSAGTAVAAQSGGTPNFIRVAKGSSASSVVVVVGNFDAGVDAWTFNGTSWTQTGTLGPITHAGDTQWISTDAAINPNGNRVAVRSYGHTGGPSYVEVFGTDLSSWFHQQSIQVGATDASGGGAISGDQFDAIAWSRDTRVIAAGAGAVNRSSSFVGGVYVLQALGNVNGTGSYEGVQPYAQTALITGVGGSSVDFGSALALSDDGQFLCIGASAEPNAGSGRGIAYGVNKLQSITGEIAVSSAPSLVNFASPHPTTNDYRFGVAIGMNANGQTVGIAGRDPSNSGITEVRVFAQTLDDQLTGITNDAFANAIVLPGTIGQVNVVVDPIKSIAASLETDEPCPSTIGGAAIAQISRSLWFKITPASNGTFACDTLLSVDRLDSFFPIGSVYSDTFIQVYSGSAIGSLTEVASGFGDDEGTSGTPDEFLSAVSGIAMTGGTTYHIQVGLYPQTDAALIKLRYSLT